MSDFVSFSPDKLNDLMQSDAIMKDLAKRLKCRPEEVNYTALKLQDDVDRLRDEIAITNMKIAKQKENV